MAGHCVRHPELPVSNRAGVLWEPIHGETVRGGQSLTYTGLGSTAEMKACIEDRVILESIVARGDSTRTFWCHTKGSYVNSWAK